MRIPCVCGIDSWSEVEFRAHAGCEARLTAECLEQTRERDGNAMWSWSDAHPLLVTSRKARTESTPEGLRGCLVIEVTDEMLEAFLDADVDCPRDGIARVLAIVERDYCLVPAECRDEHTGKLDADSRNMRGSSHE